VNGAVRKPLNRQCFRPNCLKHMVLDKVHILARGTAEAGSRLYGMPSLTPEPGLPCAQFHLGGRRRHFFLSAMCSNNHEESWREIPGYEGFYDVSNCGRVRSKDRIVEFTKSNGTQVEMECEGIVLSPSYSGQYEYPSVSLRKNGDSETRYIHRLVAAIFIGKPEGKIGIGVDAWQVNHIDGDPENNHVSNLEWCKPQENIDHSWDLGNYPLGENHPQSELTEQDVRIARRLRREKEMTYGEISNVIGVSKSHTRRVIIGDYWAEIKNPPPVNS